MARTAGGVPKPKKVPARKRASKGSPLRRNPPRQSQNPKQDDSVEQLPRKIVLKKVKRIDHENREEEHDRLSYMELILRAVTELQLPRKGCSRQAISKYLDTHYPEAAERAGNRFKSFVGLNIKKAVENGTLKQIRASFKLSEEEAAKRKRLKKKQLVDNSEGSEDGVKPLRRSPRKSPKKSPRKPNAKKKDESDSEPEKELKRQKKSKKKAKKSESSDSEEDSESESKVKKVIKKAKLPKKSPKKSPAKPPKKSPKNSPKKKKVDDEPEEKGPRRSPRRVKKNNDSEESYGSEDEKIGKKVSKKRVKKNEDGEPPKKKKRVQAKKSDDEKPPAKRGVPKKRAAPKKAVSKKAPNPKGRKVSRPKKGNENVSKDKEIDESIPIRPDLITECVCFNTTDLPHVRDDINASIKRLLRDDNLRVGIIANRGVDADNHYVLEQLDFTENEKEIEDFVENSYGEGADWLQYYKLVLQKALDLSWGLHKTRALVLIGEGNDALCDKSLEQDVAKLQLLGVKVFGLHHSQLEDLDVVLTALD